MAKQILSHRVCDKHNERPAREIRFELDGRPYVFDACGECEDAFGTALAPWAKLASAQRAKAATTRTGRASYTYAARAVPKLVRDWAQANGVDCPARGRIPRSVEDQYLAATR